MSFAKARGALAALGLLFSGSLGVSACFDFEAALGRCADAGLCVADGGEVVGEDAGGADGGGDPADAGQDGGSDRCDASLCLLGVMPAPVVYAVAALPPDEIWVGGALGYVAQVQGESLSAHPLGGGAAVRAISGRSNEVWAAASDQRLHRRTGGSWAAPLPQLAAGKNTLDVPYALYSPRPAALYAAGAQSFLYEWDGGATATNLRFDEGKLLWRDFWAIHGVDDETWAVGRNLAILRRAQAGWTEEAPPLGVESQELRGVWACSPEDVWAVGDKGAVLHRGDAGWTQSTELTGRSLSAVWGKNSAEVWVVGDSATVLHFGDGGWSFVPTPVASNIDFTGVAGLGDDLWVIGKQGSSPDAGFVFHFRH